MNIEMMARELAPELDWIVSVDPEETGGTGDQFAGAAVGLEGAPATITIAKMGERWICELVASRGNAADPNGERQAFIVCKGATDLRDAWNAMIQMCRAAGSIHRGLEAARQHGPQLGATGHGLGVEDQTLTAKISQ